MSINLYDTLTFLHDWLTYCSMQRNEYGEYMSHREL